MSLSLNIDIYINPNLENDNNNELNQPIVDNKVIFYNMKIIDELSQLIVKILDYQIGIFIIKYKIFNIFKGNK